MRTIGVIDIGTNSIRLAVARIDTSHHIHRITQQKEIVRLGEGEFAHNRITRPAMERGLVVVKNFVDIAKNNGASDVFAVATAAVREAQNKSEFVDRALKEANIEIKVVSGLEEARLIYMGIASGAELGTNRGFFVDIGGGTTELIIGDAKDYSFLESLKLGAIRMSEIFPSGTTGTVSKKKYKNMLDYVRGVANYAFRKIKNDKFDIAFGSSGTIMNLGEITARRLNSSASSIRNYNLKYSDLVETNQMLCGLTLEQRRNVPGINPERADIIIGGAAILEAIMEGIKADSIKITDRALRDGLLVDHLFQEEGKKQEYLGSSPRERSIIQLCNNCKFEESHSAKVTELSLSIFKQTKELGLHNYGDEEEEILKYAAMVHDIGTFISINDHHRHSYYLIRNWGLLGFDDEQIEMIAVIAMCHRKLSPKKVLSTKMGQSEKRLIEVLASILRIADSLDRSQLGLVRELIIRTQKPTNRMVLEVYASEDCPLEMWSFETKKLLFEQVFEADLSIKRIVTS